MSELRSVLDETLKKRAGSYLKPVRYDSRNNQVCAVCGGFKDAKYRYCRGCYMTHMATKDDDDTKQLLANRVACGFYAVEEWGQTYKVLHDYKEATPAADDHRLVIKSILSLHTLGHLDCLQDKAGVPVTAWATVPSTKSSKRFGKKHPLHELLREVLPMIPEVVLSTDRQKTREFDPDTFTLISDPDERKLKHILLIDDSWVTGSTVQSAAACLKLAGAGEVSIYCVGRIVTERYIKSLNPSPLKNFETALHYKPGWCPWHRIVEK